MKALDTICPVLNYSDHYFSLFDTRWEDMYCWELGIYSSLLVTLLP